jgi:hypothetical protein
MSAVNPLDGLDDDDFVRCPFESSDGWSGPVEHGEPEALVLVAGRWVRVCAVCADTHESTLWRDGR